MPPTAANPVYANVAFFLIPGFGDQPVAGQAAGKEALEVRMREALSGMPAGERIVLDADQGLAIVMFGEPERTLDFARKLNAPAGGTALHAGINFGPLALTTRGTDARVFGDGLAAAVAAARFSTPGKLLVTEEFARMLEATAPDRAFELAPAGEFTDTQVRLHSFYSPDAKRAVRRRRDFLKYAAVGVAGILLSGAIGRQVYQRFFPALPAVVNFEIKPRGEIFVDGVSQGRTPPMTKLEIPAGRYQIEVRSPGAPPLELQLNLKAGEIMTVKHTFGRTPPPSLLDKMKRGLGW